jgi:predicted secreted hydrolase
VPSPFDAAKNGAAAPAETFQQTAEKIARDARDVLTLAAQLATKRVNRATEPVVSLAKPVAQKVSREVAEGAKAVYDYIPPLGLQKAGLNLVEFLVGESDDRKYSIAKPGYKFSFPADDTAHNKFKSEWWYYTGHLESEDHRRYGYELTFFRHKLFDRNYYSAHFALTNVDAQQFNWKERSTILHPSSAGSSETVYSVWNGDWKAFQRPDGSHDLAATARDFGIYLNLGALARPVVHGVDGVSRKGDGTTNTSHYYSRSNMPTIGFITDHGKTFSVKGNSWMDHEFFTNMTSERTKGWNWYSIQLENQSQLMLYLILKNDGSVDPNSSGTIINADGTTKHLSKEQFDIKSTGSWRSPTNKALYPSGWEVKIPSEDISLRIDPLVKGQELDTEKSVGVSYWEGACSVAATVRGKEVKGNSYVELTGYVQDLSKLPKKITP